MVIKFKKLVDIATMPCKAHKSDAGFDLTATSKSYDAFNIVYGTGIAVEIPTGYVGLVFPRSSVAKKELLLSNSVGVIDNGYRGEIMLKFKPSKGTYDVAMYRVGERIGQLVIMPIPDVEFVESDTLANSERGDGGYGSTGI